MTIAAYEEEVTRLKLSLDFVSDELIAQNAANELLQESMLTLDTLEAYREELQRRNDILVDDNRSLRDELGKLRESLMNIHSKEPEAPIETIGNPLSPKLAKHIKSQPKDISSEIMVLKDELDAVRAKLNRQENENERKTKEIESLREDVFILHKEKDDLQHGAVSSLIDKDDKLKETQTELENAQLEVQMLRQDTLAATAKIEHRPQQRQNPAIELRHRTWA